MSFIPEPEASGGSVDGRVRGIHIPAQTRVPPPLSRGCRGPEEAPKLPQLQELQVVYDQDCLGPAQVLPTCGAPSSGMGGGECR